MRLIRNPVIHGFNPDPSFIRVGDDYYIATSTFEWFPGVQLHHSRDLVHWRLIGHALTRSSQIDLRGIVDSGGVWAPSLSHSDGQFWLMHTKVCTRVTNFKDVQVFVSTAPDILGPWSEPTYLNSIGFDPSLFHDDDGRKWVVNMMWDFRKNHTAFAGIVVQEYDHAAGKLIGPMTNVLAKTMQADGPNIYKRNGYYYLMMADGGTGWNHGISMARARNITGPYEMDPQESVLTTRDDYTHPLQKSGHGELVQTPSGDYFLAHLCSRPVAPERRCMLGREVAIQRVIWSDDGWLRLENGGVHPQVEVRAPEELPETPWPAVPDRDDFDSEKLDVNWSTLRAPAAESWLSLTERPGWLRLRGRECQHSLFDQSLIARRLQNFRCTVETCVEFEPDHFTQMAGLICWYDTHTYFYLRITHDEERGIVVGLVLADDSVYDEIISSDMIVHWKRYYLRAEIDHARLQFCVSPDGRKWKSVRTPVALDASKLSEDYGRGLHFTGAFVGICAQDIAGTKKHADFDYFEMKNGA